MRIGDNVKLTKDVIARVGTGKFVQGVIVELLCDNKVARVDFKGTWNSITGETIRSIPVANIRKVK